MYLVEETLQQSEKGCFSYWPTYCWAEWDSLATFHGGAWSLSHREKQHCGNTWTILPLMLPCSLAKTQVRCTIKNSKYSCVCINCAWKKKALKQGLCEVACLCKQMVVPWLAWTQPPALVRTKEISGITAMVCLAFLLLMLSLCGLVCCG